MSQQLNSGRQQRAITPTVTTASFKPLSLDEIMLVPLTKQKAEDQMIMDMDELDLMATNSLGADNAYVNAQRDAFKGEVGNVRDRLMSEGVDRSLINKFKGLRSRKNLEFSVNGNTGKANAAYNTMQLNKKNIMNDPKLSSEQKRLGILEAEGAYNNAGGVSGGAEYIDYIGNEYIDTNAEAQKIAAQMTPLSIGESLGYTFDGKQYKDTSGKTVILKPEQIQRVAYQTMKSNTKTMAYLQEAERLNIIPSSDDALKQAAINAGNMYQRNDSTMATNAQVGAMGNGSDTTTVADQNWSGVDLSNAMPGLYNEETEFDDARMATIFETNGMIEGVDPLYDESREAALAAEFRRKFTGAGRREMTAMGYSSKEIDGQMRIWEDNNPSYTASQKQRAKIKKSMNDLKSKYPLLSTQLVPAVMGEDGVTVLQPARPYTEREIYTAFQQGRKKAAFQFSQAIMPMNVDNTFNNYVESLIGTKERPGTFASMTMSIDGSEPGSLEATAKNDLVNVDPDDLRQAIATTGKVIGFLPGHSSMPGAYAIQFVDPNDAEKTRVLSVKGSNKSKQIFNTVSRMNNQILKAIPHTKQVVMNSKGVKVNQHIVTQMNPATGEMSAYTINTKGEDYTKEDIDSFEFVYNRDKGVDVAYKDGVMVVPPLTRKNYDQEIQIAQSATSNMFDSTLTKNTTK